MRRIGEPVVAAAPAGVRVRTRLHLSEDEAAALGALGQYLGSVYRRELAHRISMGRLDRKAHALWRAERKRAVTAVASSRWAGAITRACEDQYQLGMRALSAQVADLRAAIAVLERRCGLRPGETSAPAQDGQGGPRRGSRRSVRGYASAAQRFSKTRRLATLRARLAAAEAELDAGGPSITMGGNRLWRTRHNLAAAEITEQQWRGRWDAARMFLTADGESGKAGGNETIRVDAHGQLRIKVPVALADRFGTHLLIAAPVMFNHRSDEWGQRVRDRRAVRYDITAVVMENLDFADARCTGRETLGRGRRGKRLRRTVAGIPTAKFRSRLTSMASHRSIAVIGVDPAYTSMWGRQHWRTPLQQQTSDPATVTAHHGAAAAIGRRGLGVPIRRRPAGPRTQQRMRAGTPPARPDQPPGTTRRCRSSGSPPRPPPRRGTPVHQRTPTVSGQLRSGRTGLTPEH